jgi:hypothetical protein
MLPFTFKCGNSGRISRPAIVVFPSLKIRKLGDQKFKDDHEMETVVTLWMIAPDSSDTVDDSTGQ